MTFPPPTQNSIPGHLIQGDKNGLTKNQGGLALTTKIKLKIKNKDLQKVAPEGLLVFFLPFKAIPTEEL